MKHISIFVILTVLGILYEKYKLKYVSDEELDKYHLIKKYLLTGSDNLGRKPILWVHSTHKVNARHWPSFYSRNTTKLNQPYLLSCLETIVKHFGKSFNICLIDDSSFERLIPEWTVSVRRLASPVREHIRALAMSKLLYTYGGIQIPDSTIVLKDLRPLYDSTLRNKDCFVGETLSRNDTATYTSAYPNKEIIGCKKNSPVIKEYIGYLERLNSRDYTAEIDFLGEMERYLYMLTEDGRMNKINACLFGARDVAGSDVTIDRLLGSHYIDFDPAIYAIYIPRHEVLSRTKFEWFARLSQEQLMKCDAIIAKWLIISQNQKI